MWFIYLPFALSAVVLGSLLPVILPSVLAFFPLIALTLFSLGKCAHPPCQGSFLRRGVSLLSPVPAAGMSSVLTPQPVSDFRHFSSWWDLSSVFQCMNNLFAVSFLSLSLKSCSGGFTLCGEVMWLRSNDSVVSSFGFCFLGRLWNFVFISSEMIGSVRVFTWFC